MQDSEVQNILKEKVDGSNVLATGIKTTLNIGANVGGDTHMENEETPGSSSFPYRPIKLSSMDIFIDRIEGHGNQVFDAFSRHVWQCS